MRSRISHAVRFSLFGGLLSPLGWMVRALILLGAFGVLHSLGWRDDTSVLSGTLNATGRAGELAAMRGVIYGFSYFAAIIAVPILMLGAAVLAVMQRLWPLRRPDAG